MLKSWLGVKILAVALTIGFFGTSVAMGLSTLGSNLYYGFGLVASAYYLWIVFALIGKMKADKDKRPIVFDRL